MIDKYDEFIKILERMEKAGDIDVEVFDIISVNVYRIFVTKGENG